ncbi:F-box/LRR-repeat protein 4-like protein [Tanacetum coccineum]|uniref:F-box/LRR-repeat protein 4-like protein n=1 Tax=Tanacetum coccineum TaxID=301880 RepID=A0ABQ4YS12_9ASTR
MASTEKGRGGAHNTWRVLYSNSQSIYRSLCAIGKGCKNLKSLSDCYFLSDMGLEAVAASFSELAHLEVNGWHNIGTYGLESIERSCM